ncbi:MAG: 3-deoxy-D-manno-octulosonic acid transferase [Candidatus Omnitrophica bacterium]|nr:3-deoxy-D-manno-octulosonic acid transferase [Candidatus Omnitrophota bacterium]
MRLIYDLIFLLIAVFYLPAYLLRGKFHSGFRQRLGFPPKNLSLKKPVWIHAVSVGEALTAKGLIADLHKAFPKKKFVISTVTPTGNKIVRSYAAGGDFVTYLPLDFSFITGRVIKKIDPALFIIVETELWPNLITALNRKGIPIVLVNGRISDSSFKGYRAVKFLLKPVLEKVDLFLVQTGRDADRLMRLGVSAQKVKVTGNMKFDAVKNLDTKKDYSVYKSRLGLMPEEKILIAGSTHRGEESRVLSAYKALSQDFGFLRLIIAPRHPERAPEIERLIRRAGFTPHRISSLLEKKIITQAGQDIVFILDTIGHLFLFFSVSDIVFMGGSLVKKGGHNILEPASLAKPVVFGPHMANFRDIAELFLNNNAAIRINGAKELEVAIRDLLKHPEQMLELGRAAKRLILENEGATRSTLEHIENIAFS